eukprot:746463-Hanusia_phi.AAC.7
MKCFRISGQPAFWFRLWSGPRGIQCLRTHGLPTFWFTSQSLIDKRGRETGGVKWRARVYSEQYEAKQHAPVPEDDSSLDDVNSKQHATSRDWNFSSCRLRVSTGDGHTCVIASDIPSNLEIGQQANREIRFRAPSCESKSKPDRAGVGGITSSGKALLPSGAHGCALYTSSQEAVDQSFGLPAGKIACWGWNATGQLYAPSDLSFKEVSCGFSHTCALNSIGKIFCWGNPAEGRIDSPAAAGHAHTCAIDQQGQPVCWGSQEMTEGISLSQVLGKISSTLV